MSVLLQEKTKSVCAVIMDVLPLCVAYVDTELCYRYANASYEKLFPVNGDPCPGRRVEEVSGPDVFFTEPGALQRALKGEKVRLEVGFRDRTGQAMVARVEYIPDYTEDGRCEGFVVFVKDISGEKKGKALSRGRGEVSCQVALDDGTGHHNILSRGGETWQDVERQLVLSDSIFLHSSEGICITGADVLIEQVNPAFVAITGYSEEEVLGKNPKILRSDHQDKAFYEEMWDALEKTGCWEGEIWNRRKNGEAYLEHLAITSVTDRKDKVSNYVAVFRDISELYSSKKQIAYYTSFDALTGLPNRNFFVNHFTKIMAAADPDAETFAVGLLDLDNLRDVNESLGYEVGDRLLKRLAIRIRRCCRSQDTVARLGGDKFSFLVSESGRSMDEILCIMTRILETVARPFTLEGELAFIKGSIGIAVFPDHGDNAQLLLQKAELALYQAKSLGKSRVKVFTESVQEEVQRRLSLRRSLGQALLRGEFELYYQPKVVIQDQSINGVEALIRWRHRDGQLIPPDEFIPLAEESELITEIGTWVIEEAAGQLQIWHGQGLGDFTVAINLSARQFVDPDLLDKLCSAIDRHGLSASDLQPEITEHTMVEELEQAVAIMKEITEQGFAISIDDFGTGFSSLAYLREFPISTLKIDRTFVKKLPDNKHDLTIVNLALSLARSLGMSVIAEGVETDGQLECLARLGCDEYQGYLCSRPLPAKELEDFLSHRDAV